MYDFEAYRNGVLSGEFKVNTEFLPANDRVFTLMFLNSELMEIVVSAITGKRVHLLDNHVEYNVDAIKAFLNRVRFDAHALDEDNCIYTMDLNRAYFKKRQRNREIYYASKAIAAQEVPESYQYEQLKQVSIIFLLENNTTHGAPPISKVQLTDLNTMEIYSDLLTLYEVNINICYADVNEEIIILSDFFGIKTNDDFKSFVVKGNERLRQLLTVEYINAVIKDEVIISLEGVEHYMIKNLEKYLVYEREEGRQEGITKGYQSTTEALRFIILGKDTKEIIGLTGLSEADIESLRGVLSLGEKNK